jgi:hypothetical protein
MAREPNYRADLLSALIMVDMAYAETDTPLTEHPLYDQMLTSFAAIYRVIMPEETDPVAALRAFFGSAARERQRALSTGNHTGFLGFATIGGQGNITREVAEAHLSRLAERER